MNEPVRLQVMICTIGRGGIERVVRGKHPAVPGVEYLVSWQQPDEAIAVPAELASRSDFRISITPTRGLGLNRRLCMERATAPLLLVGDDDVDYSEEGLEKVMESFDSHPDLDMLTFRYASDAERKHYPSESFDFRHIPSGYNVSSIEMAFRREAMQRLGVAFNPSFGVGALFPSGEDTVFFLEALGRGAKGAFIPFDICFHPGDSTGIRSKGDPVFIETKGAIISRFYRFSWPLRMLLHAVREGGADRGIGRTDYMRAWLRGVKKARRHSVYK